MTKCRKSVFLLSCLQPLKTFAQPSSSAHAGASDLACTILPRSTILEPHPRPQQAVTPLRRSTASLAWTLVAGCSETLGRRRPAWAATMLAHHYADNATDRAPGSHPVMDCDGTDIWCVVRKPYTLQQLETLGR